MNNEMKNRSKVITFPDFDIDDCLASPQIVRALVVDSDDRIRKIHEDILKALGVETRSVETGQEALETISYDRVYDLILIRRFLPVIDGVQVTKMLRDMEYPSTIIGVAHPLQKDERKEFFNAGLNNCIDFEIPLSVKTVETLVRSLPPHQNWPNRVNYNVTYNSFFRPDSRFRYGQIYHPSSGSGSGSGSSSRK